MLTRQQHKLFQYIVAHISSDGVAPTYTEMCAHMGLASKSGIARLIDELEGRKYLRRLPRKARALEILKPPAALGGQCPICGRANPVSAGQSPASPASPAPTQETV